MPKSLSGLLNYYRSFWNVYQLEEKAKWKLWDSSQNTVDKTERVSLVVLGNEDTTQINAFLASLKQQTWLPDEAILVGLSAAESSELQKKEALQENLPFPVRFLDNPGNSPGAARNLGIDLASYPIVVLGGVDCLPEPEWLQQLLTPLMCEPTLAFSLGEVFDPNPVHLALQRFYKSEKTHLPRSPFTFEKSLALRKIWWARAGGFPEDVPPFTDSSLFAERLLAQEITCACNPAAKVNQGFSVSTPKTWKLAFKMAVGEGRIGLFAPFIWKQLKYFLGAMSLALTFILFLGGTFKIGFIPAAVSFVFLGLWMLVWGKALNRAPGNESANTWARNWLLAGLALSRFLGYLWGVRQRSQTLDNLNKQAERHLEKIVSAHPDRKGIIVYFPTHDWGHMFQRPQQMARHLAQAGYLFFYGTKNEISDAVYEFHLAESNLYLVSMPAVPPEVFRTVGPVILYIGAAWHAALLDLYPDSLSIYDHYDDLKVSSAQVEDHETLLQRADAILASSQQLFDTVKHTRPDVLFIPNAVDDKWVEKFQPKPEIPPPPDLLPILQKNQPIIGYSGALAEWFDYPLLAEVSKQHPEWQIVLLGVNYDHSLDNSGILDMPNVHWLGQKPYDQLFHYVWRFDVATIPFKINEITYATSPIKLFEYFFCQKPVVSTPLPECARYNQVLIADTPETFSAQIQQALTIASSQEYRDAVCQAARSNTWEQRVKLIVSRLNEIKHLKNGGRD
ncbi:MAG: glycosyltransferase [Chloroflexi bacterium]|nr:glycosyltransferase [Chloroflexota bacterium]